MFSVSAKIAIHECLFRGLFYLLIAYTMPGYLYSRDFSEAAIATVAIVLMLRCACMRFRTATCLSEQSYATGYVPRRRTRQAVRVMLSCIPQG